MSVRVYVDSRSNQSTNLYWNPFVEAKVYNLYVSLSKSGPYTLVASNIPNNPDPITPNVRYNRTSFSKPGKITYTLSNSTAGVTAAQEFFVKVTVVDSQGEDPIAVAFTRHIKLPGRAGTVARNIDTEKEKGVLGWFEDENIFRRIHASYQDTSADDRYSLDVKLVESEAAITNAIDSTTGLPIPLETVSGTKTLSRSLNSGIDLSASELNLLVGTPTVGRDFEVHSVLVKLNSAGALTGSVVIAYQSGATEFILQKAEFAASPAPIDFFLSLDSRLVIEKGDFLKVYTTGVSGAGVTADVLHITSNLS